MSIGDCTIKIVQSLKHYQSIVVISNLIPKGDKYSDKNMQLGEILKENCTKKTFLSVNHYNINQR